MLLGKVSGSVWSTRKDEKLNGWKFMVVQVWDTETKEQKKSLIAADNAGAGIGDMVLITQGQAARISAEKMDVPIDAMIVGIVDSLDTEN
ncbi:EutN/CcmL family microcompartment protein [Enterococcus mediterraneensis]|uniref:EutN/CcmL family microcompartment protein n=1 Tax=Enterococcus mediterraneensis TaxID=2364791 RepID=UPI000F04AE47|nr:EutN/CcmL family microcompartment protein [Enterococcus mediterraneensis]